MCSNVANVQRKRWNLESELPAGTCDPRYCKVTCADDSSELADKGHCQISNVEGVKSVILVMETS